MAASASECLNTPGCQIPFSLKPILAELEGSRYVGRILPLALGALVSRANWRGGSGGGGGGSSSSGSGSGNNGGGSGDGGSSDGNRGGSGGATANKRKSSSTVGDARVRVRYNSHLPDLSLQDGESTRSILVVMVLPTLHGAVLCKNW